MIFLIGLGVLTFQDFATPAMLASGMTREDPLWQHPPSPTPLHMIGYAVWQFACATVAEIRCMNHYRELRMYILTSLAPNAEDLDIGFALNSPKPIIPLALFARCDSANQPAALDSAVLFRTFPPFPLYSIAGAVDGARGAG